MSGLLDLAGTAVEHVYPIEQFKEAFEHSLKSNRKRDYAVAERYWSPEYIQHSAHIPPGREGLSDLVKNAPGTLRYENQLILVNGDFVMLHGRFSGLGPGIPNWIVVDIVRVESATAAVHHGHGRSRPRCRGGRGRQTLASSRSMTSLLSKLRMARSLRTDVNRRL